MDQSRSVAYVLGVLLVSLAVLMLLPALADSVSGNPDSGAFVLAAVITGFCGGALALGNQISDLQLSHRAAFLVTVLGWVVISAFGALPFVFSGLGFDYADAFFESISGFTTTGSTVLVGLDRMPPGILLWRALTQWVGGIGIIAMAVAILPFLRIGGMQLFRTESSDRSDKVLPRPGQIALAIGEVYLLLTLLCVIGYLLTGMTAFDAVTHAMTTLSTGGYSTHDASFAYFTNPLTHWVAALFMILGSLPLVLYVYVAQRGTRAISRDVQARTFLLVFAVVSLVLAFSLWSDEGLTVGDAFRYSAFNVASIMSSTGYASADYTLWGPFATMIFFVLTFLGGCTGSTAGGIKTFRLQILALLLKTQLRQMLYPHASHTPRYGDKQISSDIIASVALFVFIYMAGIALLATGLAAIGLDFETSLSGAATAIGNVGPGLGSIIGPAGNFKSVPDSAKWMLSAGMLLGRLELLTVLVVISPDFWRR